MAAIGALRRLTASALALGRIRAELLAIEVQEEKRRVAALLFWSILGALATGFAAVFVAVAITVWWWDSHREWVLTLCAAGMVALAAVAGWRARSLVAAPSTLFQASLAELRRDEAALRGPPGPAAGRVNPVLDPGREPGIERPAAPVAAGPARAP